MPSATANFRSPSATAAQQVCLFVTKLFDRMKGVNPKALGVATSSVTSRTVQGSVNVKTPDSDCSAARCAMERAAGAHCRHTVLCAFIDCEHPWIHELSASVHFGSRNIS